jgi:NAD(P)-dependent dehydrogenase (short-subunit alcohol dehydrogenase family)
MTGTSKGMGRSIAAILAQAGAGVVVSSRKANFAKASVGKAELLIGHCPARPGQLATRNFGNGFRPNWVGSRRPLRRSGGCRTRPNSLNIATKTKILAKKQESQLEQDKGNKVKSRRRTSEI